MRAFRDQLWRRAVRRAGPARGSIACTSIATLALGLGAGGCGTGGLQVSGRAPVSYASALTAVVGCSGRSQLKPSALGLRCDSPRATLTHLRWTGWGLPTATATGALLSGQCASDRPTEAATAATAGDCAEPARVVVTDLALGEEAAQYRSLKVSTGTGASTHVRRYDVDDRGPAIQK